MPHRRTVYIGAGANIGDRLTNLREGLRRLQSVGHLAAVSSLYESEPVGGVPQPSFYNAVCAVETGLGLEVLLGELKRIEWELGRRPGLRWGPRPLDLDILLAGSEVVTTPILEVPHPRLAERGFVLVPLAELVPEVVVAGIDQTVAALRSRAGDAGVRRIAGQDWWPGPAVLLGE